MSDRQVFHSTHTEKEGWHVLLNGKTVSKHETQRESHEDAKNRARNAFKKGGLGQAVLHKENGTIQTEHTYGKDPERTAG
jgi:hypothetical protein